jgi:hypothetical protein
MIVYGDPRCGSGSGESALGDERFQIMVNGRRKGRSRVRPISRSDGLRSDREGRWDLSIRAGLDFWKECRFYFWAGYKGCLSALGRIEARKAVSC